MVLISSCIKPPTCFCLLPSSINQCLNISPPVRKPAGGVKLVTLPLSQFSATIMKKYARVFRYIGQYKSEAFLYILFIVLSIVFSLVSLAMLFPFLEMLFNGDKPGHSGFIGTTTNPIVI